MSVRLATFYQHMPPYGSAAALRGDSIVRALAALMGDAPDGLCVITTTAHPAPIRGVNVVRLSIDVESATGLVARTWGELRMGWAAARTAVSTARRTDLLLVSSPSYLAALIICARARRHGMPYALDIRDIYPQAYAEAGLIRRHGLLYRFLAARSRAMYRGARCIVTATQGLAREVQAQAPGVRAVCVYNGFPAALGARRASKHERFTVCFHGALGFFQDVTTLIEVARRLEPLGIDAVVIGYGRKEAMLRDAGLDNLRFLGRLPFEQTVAEVERCHVGLCLRCDDDVSRDAFPVKVWEYLGLGIPSVVTPPCEAGAFLERHGCGVQLPAGAVDSIVDAIVRLRTDEQWHSLGQRCRVVAARFTRENLGAEAARILYACLPSERSP